MSQQGLEQDVDQTAVGPRACCVIHIHSTGQQEDGCVSQPRVKAIIISVKHPTRLEGSPESQDKGRGKEVDSCGDSP
jgi:hypothetical protein